jgi:mono/diheme cytochrome c family protein
MLSIAVDAPAKKGSSAAGAAASSGVFTKGQASRGSKRFQQVCSGCHRIEDVKGRWFRDPPQMTVGDMFEKISTTMPDGKPGSLSPTEYADIIAFVLKSKEYPAGDKELPADLGVLKKVRLDAH